MSSLGKLAFTIELHRAKNFDLRWPICDLQAAKLIARRYASGTGEPAVPFFSKFGVFADRPGKGALPKRAAPRPVVLSVWVRSDLVVVVGVNRNRVRRFPTDRRIGYRSSISRSGWLESFASGGEMKTICRVFSALVVPRSSLTRQSFVPEPVSAKTSPSHRRSGPWDSGHTPCRTSSPRSRSGSNRFFACVFLAEFCTPWKTGGEAHQDRDDEDDDKKLDEGEGREAWFSVAAVYDRRRFAGRFGGHRPPHREGHFHFCICSGNGHGRSRSCPQAKVFVNLKQPLLLRDGFREARAARIAPKEPGGAGLSRRFVRRAGSFRSGPNLRAFRKGSREKTLARMSAMRESPMIAISARRLGREV